MAGFYRDYDAQQSQSTSERSFKSPIKAGRGRIGFGRHGSERYAGLGLSDEGQEQVEQLYDSVIRFRGSHQLPEASQLFISRPKEEPHLKKLKDELTSSLQHGQQFDQHLWDRHVHFMHKGGLVLSKMRAEFELELCTSHWLDLQLILWTFSVIPAECSKLRSVHLYDTAGAQTASLNHYLRSHRPDCDWAWRGMSWNPYFEGHENEDLLLTDRFMYETNEMWYFGGDNTGDIRKEGNREGVKDFAEALGEVNLITALGDIPDSVRRLPSSGAQVSASRAQLLLAEVTVALELLSAGGGLVLLVDDFTSSHSLQLAYLLVCCFHEVSIYKPATASSFDRRFYYVCLSYIGADSLPPGFLRRLTTHCSLVSPSRCLFPPHTISEPFVKQYLENISSFLKTQIAALREVAELFDSMRRRDKELVNMVKTHVVDKFKTYCKLKKITQDKRVIKHMFLDGSPSHMSIARMLVPRDPEVTVRAPDAIVASLEEQVKRWNTPEEQEDDYYTAVAKKPRMEDKRSFSLAVRKFVTSQTFWEGAVNMAGPPVDIDPESIKWLQGPVRPLETVSTKQGAHVQEVSTSPFCPGNLAWRMFSALQASFLDDPEKGKKLRELESHFSAAHWFGDPRAGSKSDSHFLGHEGLLLSSLDLLADVVSPLMTQSAYGTDPLEFLDLSGAPSGFSKYICFRTQDSAKGWGVVRSECPVRQRDPEMELYNSWLTFKVIGPPHGMDVTKNSNIASICDQLKRECPDGVKLIIGDALCGSGQDVPPSRVEIHAKTYLLSMCQIALQVLAKGGTFVCRVADIHTRFSAGLLFLLYRSFKQIAVVKSFMSAPSTAERFIIAKGFQGIKSAVTAVLEISNDDIHELQAAGSTQDLLEIVPMRFLFEENFFQYLYHINQQTAKRRLAVVSALEHYLNNPEELPSTDTIDEYRSGVLEVLGITEMATSV